MAVTEKCGESSSGPVQGVDVSDYQGSFDFASAHVQFGYAQISDGLHSVDWSFDGNWSRMKSAGVLRGAYQYFEPGQDEVAQANMMVSKVGRLGEGDLPAMIDVETTSGLSGSEIGSKVRTWLEIVEKGTGLRPIIYTGSYFWEDNVGTNLSSYPIWIAAYGSACPSLPQDGWSNWTFWQYSDGGSSNLDHDVFNGSLSQLKALSGAAPPPSPTSVTHLGNSVVPNRDGRLEAFSRGADDALWHAWQETAGGSWSGWSSLGGTIAGDPVVIQNADGRLEAFAVVTGGAVYHTWQKTVGGSWSGWSNLGGSATSSLAIGANKDGHLELFARSTDNAIWHMWQHPGGGWSDWASLGGILAGDPTVAYNEDGRLEVFGLGADASIQHIWQTTANGTWSGWSSLGGKLASAPSVASNHDGRLEVFARAPDDTAFHVWQMTAGGSWSGWSSMGYSMVSHDTPTATENLDGRIEVFLLGTDAKLYHRWQNTPDGAWSNWAGMGGMLVE